MDKALWMARLLYCHGPLTRKEILEAWREMDECDRPMAQSTFYDNRKFMKERYGLLIELDHGRYVLKKESDQEKSLTDFLLEEIPEKESEEEEIRGGHWQPILEEAIALGHQLRMTYAPLDKKAYETDFSVYCLRQFRRIGYAIGYSSRHKEIRNFALDRIQALVVLPQHYHIPSDFHEEDYFRHSFGIFGGKDIRPEPIVFEADAQLSAYLQSRPLHASQRVLTPSLCGTTRFALEVSPTKDFIAELLSFGASIKVISPLHLRKTISELLERAAATYLSE